MPIESGAFLQAVREQHPELSSIKDDKVLYDSIMQEHPELSKEVNPYVQHNFDEGVTPLSPLGYVADAGEITNQGLQGVAEKSAQYGPLGGIVGVPALVAKEMVPETEGQVAGTYLGGKAFGALGEGIQALKGAGAKAAIADAAKASAAIPERDMMAVLNDPSLLGRAKSVAQATMNYVKSIPGLNHVTESLREELGKSVPTLGDYTNHLDMVKGLGDKAQPQDLLTGIQSVNKILGHKEFPKDPDIVRGLLQDKSNLLDKLEQSNPGFSEANKALREAHIAEQFNSWFPRNKNMSPNVLRTLLAARNLGSGLANLATGNPGTAAMQGAAALASSPKAIGLGIRGAQFLGQDVKMPSLGGLFGGGASDEEGQLIQRMIDKSNESKQLRALAEHHNNVVRSYGSLGGDVNVESRLAKGVMENPSNQWNMMPEAEEAFREGGAQPASGLMTPESYGGAPMETSQNMGSNLTPELRQTIANHAVQAEKLTQQAQKAEKELATLRKKYNGVDKLGL